MKNMQLGIKRKFERPYKKKQTLIKNSRNKKSISYIFKRVNLSRRPENMSNYAPNNRGLKNTNKI